MKNFLITAEGRSGTKFLSQLMNCSKLWTVRHEPVGGSSLIMDISQIQERFNQNYYGEVNSRLRFRIREVMVEKKGIILRDPFDIWLSWANKRKAPTWNERVIEMKRIYEEFESLVDSDIKFFLFDKMVSDLSYLKQIFKYVGINDVEITKEMQMQKRNMNRSIKYHDISEFNHDIQNKVMEAREIYKRLVINKEA